MTTNFASGASGGSSKLPSLDDDIDTMIDSRLDAFQDKLPEEKNDGKDSGGKDGRPSRAELVMKMRQKQMFFGGKRMSKSAQQRRLEDAKKKYVERQKRETEAEQTAVVGSNLEKNRRTRARKAAKRKETLAKIREGQDKSN